MSYKMKNLTILDNRLGLTGKNVFTDEDFFDLKVGDQITQIGNGKNNGTIRTDLFTNPIKYVGSIMCEFDKPEKMYAFQIAETDMYILYGSTGQEIFTEEIYSRDKKTGKASSYVRFYSPEFIKVASKLKSLEDEFNNSILEQLNKTDNIIIEGLKRKGFEFENRFELENFLKTSCRIAYQPGIKQRTYFANDIAFLVHCYESEISKPFIEDGILKITGSLGSYHFL